jgi:hypothetical protein
MFFGSTYVCRVLREYPSVVLGGEKEFMKRLSFAEEDRVPW